MDSEFILILDLALTVFGYLLVPTIYCLRKKPLTAKKIKKIIILNAICVWLVFQIIRLAAGGDARVSAAVWLWSIVGHFMMKKRLLIKEEPELDTNITPAEDTTPSISIQSCNDEENKEIPETNDENLANLTALQIDTTPMDTTDTISTEEVIPLKRFCSKCGKEIDLKTKKCTGCGKQYFRGIKYCLKSVFAKKRILPIILSILLLVSGTLNILQLQDRNNLATTGESYKNLYWREYGKRLILENELNFYERYVVVVSDDGTNLYHKYGCADFDDSYFWAYNVEAAEGRGYVPHKKCCG